MDNSGISSALSWRWTAGGAACEESASSFAVGCSSRRRGPCRGGVAGAAVGRRGRSGGDRQPQARPPVSAVSTPHPARKTGVRIGGILLGKCGRRGGRGRAGKRVVLRHHVQQGQGPPYRGCPFISLEGAREAAAECLAVGGGWSGEGPLESACGQAWREPGSCIFAVVHEDRLRRRRRLACPVDG